MDDSTARSDARRPRAIAARQAEIETYAIGGTSNTSPEEIARRAGWQEVWVARRVQIPLDQISSVRAVVDVEPDPEDDAVSANDEPPLLVTIATGVIAAVLEPHCRCCR